MFSLISPECLWVHKHQTRILLKVGMSDIKVLVLHSVNSDSIPGISCGSHIWPKTSMGLAPRILFLSQCLNNPSSPDFGKKFECCCMQIQMQARLSAAWTLSLIYSHLSLVYFVWLSGLLMFYDYNSLISYLLFKYALPITHLPFGILSRFFSFAVRKLLLFYEVPFVYSGFCFPFSRVYSFHSIFIMLKSKCVSLFCAVYVIVQNPDSKSFFHFNFYAWC